jgi:hypothetical protein
VVVNALRRFLGLRPAETDDAPTETAVSALTAPPDLGDETSSSRDEVPAEPCGIVNLPGTSPGAGLLRAVYLEAPLEAQAAFESVPVSALARWAAASQTALDVEFIRLQPAYDELRRNLALREIKASLATRRAAAPAPPPALRPVPNGWPGAA